MGREEGESGEGVRKTIMIYLYENATIEPITLYVH